MPAHHAYYDDDGNIILPDNDQAADIVEPADSDDVMIENWRIVEEEVEQEAQRVEAEPVEPTAKPSLATIKEKLPAVPDAKEMLKKPKQILGDMRGSLFATTNLFLAEGSKQYRWSGQQLGHHAKRARHGFKQGSRHLWAFLTQPVWIVRPNRQPKQYNRTTLFLVDVVRFGGTFATIFLLLFLSLNYQSFYQIASVNLNPVQRAQQANEEVAELDAALRDKLLKSPTLATAGRKPGDLLSFLPSVGPPDNRIIIPKLSLNVPLVTPSYDSLLREDWDQVEEDIQDALKLGVVHYPGTARPGQAGNFFVTGHSSYYPWAPGHYKTVFASLQYLEPGDEYYVYYGGDKHRYIVRSKEEVKPTNVNVLDQPLDRRTATLMTCTPVGTTLRRLIVKADEVDPITGIVMEVGEKTQRVVKAPTPEMLPI